NKPLEQTTVNEISFTAPTETIDGRQRQDPQAVIWHGKLVQPRAGTARIVVNGARTALAIDGKLELPIGVSGRHVDLWLEQGAHDLTIFVAQGANSGTA